MLVSLERRVKQSAMRQKLSKHPKSIFKQEHTNFQYIS